LNLYFTRSYRSKVVFYLWGGWYLRAHYGMGREVFSKQVWSFVGKHFEDIGLVRGGLGGIIGWMGASFIYSMFFFVAGGSVFGMAGRIFWIVPTDWVSKEVVF